MSGSGPGRLIEARVPARPEMLKLIRALVAKGAEMCGFEGTAAHDVVIAVDEACQNIIRHAYAGETGDIVLDIYRDGDGITVGLRDFAPPVDAAKVRPRNLDDLRPGGLGTHFIREVMDTVEWFPPPPGERGNVLRLMKKAALPDQRRA